MINNQYPLSFRLGLCFFLFFALSGCRKSFHPPEGTYVVTAEKKPLVSELFFSGTLQPLRSEVVVSPVEGVIEKKYFEYGQSVKKGQVLFLVRSSQLEKEYRDALTNYLKSKAQYNTNKVKLHEDEVLQKEGIISRNEYQNSQSSASDTYLAYLQADQSLKQVLDKTHGEFEEAKNLKIEDKEAVTKALLNKVDTVELASTADGVALLPEKGVGEESSGSTKLLVGSLVKSGQVVAMIGDLSGVSIDVSVSQVDVNHIAVGQKAVVTSDGFPGLVLQGEVADVSAQAVSAVGGSLPTFPVRVDVKSIEEKNRKRIAVGMTAMIKILVEKPPAIMLPIRAVVMNQGITKVKKIEVNKGKVIDVPVMVGKTSLTEVEILQGVLPGDKVLVSR